MSTESTQIKCPNCGTDIAINEILAHQTEERLRKEMGRKMAEERNKMLEVQQQLDREKAEFEEKKKRENEIFSEKLNAAREAERKRLEEEQKLKLEEQRRALALEMEEKQGAQLKILNEELERSKAESKQIRERELELLEEKRKLKLQGEVQELAIEQWLRDNFPLDTIEEIKKGVRGADCVQIVNTHNRPDVGAIYYESKRTKDFQPSWIEKFKADMREKGALFGVLVTDVLPKDMQRLGQRDGIWICSYEEFKGLCFVLRESVVLLQHATAVQENKGEKMSMLYDFLTGNEFRMQVEAIVEGFTQMQDDLNSERRAMETIWKKREKQIQKVLFNTNQMYGSIKGIAGNAIGSIKALELPGEDDE